MTEQTEAEHLWFKNAIIYGLDVKTFLDAGGDSMGDLRGVISKLDYLADLGITCLWLLPFYPTPYRDEGYDVSNHMDVSESAGSLTDFRNLVQLAREKGIHVIIDLVVHHTSDMHPWFQASVADQHSKYRNYYVWAEQHPGHCPIKTMFPGVEDGVWQYDDNAHAFYHHIFYHFEPDLNFSNPKVREEVGEIVELWLAFGVSGFRIDAAKHLFEDKGLPGTSLDADPYLKDLHEFVKGKNKDAILLGEVNADHNQAEMYFGKGDRMQMLFNFPLNTRLWLALARQEAEPLAEYLRTLSDLPRETVWSPFIRNL
ncbi:MAG TPA: alpha-amylase family glycosyl hydrolase, partial [Methanomicrobiales archaeon]|nr:alpha-amylase family glycosyl hydrolase [Methanomicrobiales archaeon]